MSNVAAGKYKEFCKHLSSGQAYTLGTGVELLLKAIYEEGTAAQVTIGSNVYEVIVDLLESDDSETIK